MKQTRIRLRTKMVTAGVVGAVIGVLALAAPASAQEVDYTNTVTVAAGSRVEQEADLARIMFGVRSGNKEASVATNRAAEKTTAVVAALRAAGVADEELTVGGVRLDRRTDRRGNFLRYVASVSIEVETERLNALGSYIDAAVDGGATSIRNLEYDVSDRTAAVDQALREAMAFARSKAEALADADGRQVGRAIVISEYDSRPPRAVDIDGARGALAGAGGASAAGTVIPLAPPTISTRADITVTFELI